MYCTNDPEETKFPTENETIPESGSLKLCRTCFQAWQHGFLQRSISSETATTFHSAEGAFHVPKVPTLIHLPDPLEECHPSASLDFTSLFGSIPPGRVPCAFLELGEWLGQEYEAEFQVSLLLGPDGKVWAQIGEVEDLPLLAERDRETLAAQMVSERSSGTNSWKPVMTAN